ncbi:NFACT RNA binding domain-containing protein [Rosettibacter firmus]|uniref:NFACT RNA binding domain-containing protein n=1 Tax=Rosettibacter firmus TaxID=3111522 RepID=UPI00336BB166
MYKNYLYLLRGFNEIQPLIINQTVLEIYTQEKDKLFISIPLKDKDYFHIVVSSNPQFPYLIIKNEHHKAKKNVLNFFKEFLPAKLDNIEIAYADRIIKFSLSTCSLFFKVQGPFTNFYLIDANKKLIPFKKIDKLDENEILLELLNARYINEPNKFFQELQNKTDEQILNEYKFIDKSIINELKVRNGDSIKNIFSEIIYDDIRISISPNEGIVKFEPAKFYLPQNYNILAYYKSYYDALNDYLIEFNKLKKRKELYLEIKKFLNKEIERISNKLNNIKAKIDEGSKSEYYSKLGNLLLSNIFLLKKGMKEIELIDNENNKVHIELDEKLSPNQNIDSYFEKARNEKIQFEKFQNLYEELKNKYQELIEMHNKLENNLDDEELLKMKKELKVKQMTLEKSENSKINFRHYIIENKYHLFVGKDSYNNDELTLKFAKPNDYWFHARSVKGSHVVLRVENSKESIPKKIIEKSASIAAYYSKARTSGLAPVSYTLKKYVVKRKGMEPGQVSLLKEDVIIVKPEIPANCVLITE